MNFLKCKADHATSERLGKLEVQRWDLLHKMWYVSIVEFYKPITVMLKTFFSHRKIIKIYYYIFYKLEVYTKIFLSNKDEKWGRQGGADPKKMYNQGCLDCEECERNFFLLICSPMYIFNISILNTFCFKIHVVIFHPSHSQKSLALHSTPITLPDTHTSFLSEVIGSAKNPVRSSPWQNMWPAIQQSRYCLLFVEKR